MSKSYVKWRGADCIGEDCLLRSVCVCVWVWVWVWVCRERSANYVELLSSKLCGITVLVSLIQYSWLVLCKSLLCECKCSKISNFWHDKFLNLIIPAAVVISVYLSCFVFQFFRNCLLICMLIYDQIKISECIFNIR